MQTSSNGSTWSTIDLSALNFSSLTTLWKVIYAQSKFVVVGTDGLILTSPDGSNWTKKNTRTIEDLLAISHGNNKFIVSGRNEQF